MRRPLLFSMFIMDTPSHINHGTWRHPLSRSKEYNNLDLWVELAVFAEKSKLDAIFIADICGLYGDFGGSWAPIVEHAVQFPTSDPSMLISAMAHATKNLGFIYTSSVLQHHPFAFARAASTLDHLSKGRVGWNVVTSASKNGSRSMGLPTIVDHDERYLWAEEYIDVTYKLWEGSWDDDAVVRDTATGVYADSTKVRKINHSGQRYSVEGPHLVEPSPQRTPVIFQAGASSAGMNFAARHTEGVFMVSGSPEASAAKIIEVRNLATKAGRLEEDILFVEGMSFIVGDTEESALRKAAEMDEWMDDEAQAIMMSGVSGMDLANFSPDTRLVDLIDKAPGMRGAIKMVIDAAPAGEAKVRDLLRYSANRFRVVGSPEQIADKIEAYADAGVDGINIIYITLPGTYQDFVEYVGPILRERGLMKTEYEPGTLREKLFPGQGPQINTRHPARKYKGGQNL